MNENERSNQIYEMQRRILYLELWNLILCAIIVIMLIIFFCVVPA